MKNIKKKLIAWMSIFVLAASSIGMHVLEAEESSPELDKTESRQELYDGLDPDSTLLTVGKDKIPVRKAYFLIKFQQAILQGMYGSMWSTILEDADGESFQDEMKESIQKLLVRMSLAKQYQKEYGVSLSKAEEEKIKKAVDLFIASNSQEALDAMMANEQIVTEILTDYTILCKVFAAMTKDTKVTYGEAQTYSYIYASFGGEQISVLEEVSESAESLIEDFNSIHNKVSSGEDFDRIAAETGYPTAIHTYFTGDDSDRLAEFNQAMEGLKQGEVSDVTYIGNNMGIFIGCKQAVDENSLESAKESYLQNEKAKNLKKTIEQLLEKEAVELNEEVWNKVNMDKPISLYRVQNDE